MSNKAQNFRLGIFVFAGVFIFILAVYLLGNRQNLFGDNVRISSVFKDVNGLQMGNNVRFAGVNVGTVRGITIMSDTAINVDMLINQRTAHLIKKNALATISSDGLVGSMIVNIIPNDIPFDQSIEAGDTIASISKIATADMLTTLNTTNENAALLTQDLLRITNNINKGQGLFGALLKDEDMVDDFKQSLSNLQATTAEAQTTMRRLNQMIASIDLDESVAGMLLNDKESAQQLARVFDNLEISAKQIEELTKNLNDFSTSIRQSDGLLNYALHDTTIVRSLDATLKNVEEATERLNVNMEAMRHNFLLRGYFRKLDRQEAREERRQN
jgi:phospholipid/cholesterol/gamma-HCH transport system substrate-binding protein